MEKLADQITIVREKIIENLREKGKSEDQIQIELNRLDCNFLIHAFINDVPQDGSLKTSEERIKFYLKYLEMEL